MSTDQRLSGTTEAGATAGPLQVGDLLAERYRLAELVEAGEHAALWRADDEVLARPVAVKVVGTPNKPAREAAQGFLDAAIRTGAVNHPGLVRVYDASQESRPGRGNDVAYVISEWVEGEALDTHLGRLGPLAAPDAVDVLRQVADALTAAHAAGVVHGRVHPGNVLVTASGRVRVTDAQVACAVHGWDPGTPVADTRDLAAVLYALTTARWPSGPTPQPAGTLRAAPLSEGHPLSPRQLRAGLPRALDQVVTRGLEPQRLPVLGPLRTPAALADAADASVVEAREALRQETDPGPPSALRRRLPWILSAVVLLVVGVTGWLLGLAVGELPRRTNGVDAIVSTTDAPTAGAAALRPLDLTRLTVRDFDPDGDHTENPDQVPNATDGDPATAWTTSLYRTAAFGGLKPGVGLLIDLGRPTALHRVQVGFSAPGASVELRVGDTAPADERALRAVAADTKGDQVATLQPPTGTTARYVLVWLTSVPRDGSGYRVGISEIRIT